MRCWETLPPMLSGRESDLRRKLIVKLLLVVAAVGLVATASVAATDKVPKCTAPLATVEVPKAPHGLFVILFPGAAINSKATKYLVSQAPVCGANIYVVWNQVDKGPNANPRYDWSVIDEQMATPAYVFAKVPSVSCPSFGRVPVFWNDDFIQSYRSFQSAILGKYGTNSSVGYIRFGLGAGGEIYPACMYALKDHGFSEAIWQKYLFAMLDYEKSLNSSKQLAVGLNEFGNPPNLNFTAAIAERAIQDGIAIGNQGLTVEDVRNDRAGRACMADWCRLFRGARGKVPLVLQTGGATHPDHSDPGSMLDILPFALGFHVQILELYVEDWLVAYDPTDPNYAHYHDEYRKVYESAAQSLGGN
jgi:hypothetical protein